ncbi:MAG: hypothetical protein MR298_03505 [Odoribacter sp.]|nr:hypothetical protein [Odoribacter sp.]MDY3034297.1 hypothetical protein [Odoribacter sp.]
MLIALAPIAIFLIGWTMVDILRQNILMKYKVAFIVGLLVLLLVGVVIYYCIVRRLIREGRFVS